MPLTQSRDRLLGAVLGTLWSQWTALGVAGTSAEQASVVDPEALLVITALFGRYDPRLFDEALDWLAGHSHTLDVTRVRKIARRMPAVDSRILAAVLDFMRVRSDASKWENPARSLIAHEASATYTPVPLFLSADGRALPIFAEKDAWFSEHGIERSPLGLRGMSQPPALRKPTLARLRLRALAGLGVRAEVLLYLSTHEHAHGRLIAARSGFSQRQVAEYLAQLADAGFAERWDDGRTVQYRLTPHFAQSLGPAGVYVDWQGVWAAVAELWRAFESAAQQPSQYAESKVWRAAFERMQSVTPVEGMALPIPNPSQHPGDSILEYAEQYAGGTIAVLKHPVG